MENNRIIKVLKAIVKGILGIIAAIIGGIAFAFAAHKGVDAVSRKEAIDRALKENNEDNE